MLSPLTPQASLSHKPIPCDRVAYRQHNHIERMFGRLTDFRRVAPRYDKLAVNFVASVALAVTVIWRLN